MDVFVVFNIFLNFLSGLAMLFTGLFVWRRFREDFEIRTLGGILALISIIFFMIGLRILFFGAGWIGENMAFDIFFAEYIIILFLILPFALPRLLYLIAPRPAVQKMGLVLGIVLFLIFLVIHFSAKEQIVFHHGPRGLLFELPLIEKIFLMGISLFFLPIMLYRVSFHFVQWRKTKTFPYRFLEYILLFFIGAMGLLAVIPQFKPWQSALSYSFILGGVLGFYLTSSQEFIKGEELISVLEEKEKEVGEAKKEEGKTDELERLSQLTGGIESQMGSLQGEISKIKKEIEKLKKRRE